MDLFPPQDAHTRKAERAIDLPDAFRQLLQVAEGEDWNRDGLRDTPDRCSKAWLELTRGYLTSPQEILTADFDGAGYDELLLQCNIPYTSLCEHHLLPFTGVAHIGYITNGNVVGLSKLVRLVVDCYAPRLQMQERLTVQIADALEDFLEPKGAIVVVEGAHSCIACRGVRVAGSVTVTSALRGALKDKPEARAEALALIGMQRSRRG